MLRDHSSQASRLDLGCVSFRCADRAGPPRLHESQVSIAAPATAVVRALAPLDGVRHPGNQPNSQYELGYKSCTQTLRRASRSRFVTSLRVQVQVDASVKAALAGNSGRSARLRFERLNDNPSAAENPPLS